MLRLLVLLLLLANGAWYAWAQGWGLPWGFGPAQQAEPQRIAQQLRPEAVRILRPDEARRAEAFAAATARPPECLQAGLLEESQVGALNPLLEAWPPGSWSLDTTTEPARWIVYMGKYASPEQVTKKKSELRQLGISFETLANSALEPGLSLGGYATQADANRQLEALSQRGVRTARVVQERPEAKGVRLMLPAVDDTLRPRLEELKPVLGAKALRPCRGL